MLIAGVLADTDSKRRDHKLTKFGTLSFEGFGPEATESAPVSVRSYNSYD